MPPEKLKEFLEKIILELTPYELDRLADKISLKALEEAVRIEYPEHVNALQTAKKMLHEAQYYLANVECTVSLSLKTRLIFIIRSLISILESFINGFGIESFFKMPENQIDAEWKGQRIMFLLQMFSTVSTLLLPSLGPTLGAAMIGGTVLTLSALSVIYPYIKMQALYLPRGINWSEQYNRCNLQVNLGRKQTLDEIARILVSNQPAKMHVMLIGKSGIGKTETAKAFVQSIEQGEYSELRGKQVIYFNMADLLGSTEMFSSANKIFSQISDAMGRHRENYILIFDEIHMACQEKEQGTLSEQLKILLDPGRDKFPYVIGITTEEEYYREIYVNHSAFARRFQRLAIENTDLIETLKILNHSFIKQAPHTLLDENALQILVEKTTKAFGEQAPQPATSLKLLSQCIKHTATSQRAPLGKRVDEIRGQLQAIYAQGAGRLPYGRENHAPQLECELQNLEVELIKEKKALEKLFQDQQRLLELKKAILRNVLRVSHFNQNVFSKREHHALNMFSLQSHFQARVLEEKIRRAADALQVKVAISSELIDEVVKEELENEEKVQQAIERGKHDVVIRHI